METALILCKKKPLLNYNSPLMNYINHYEKLKLTKSVVATKLEDSNDQYKWQLELAKRR